VDKIAIIGSRDFPDMSAVTEYVTTLPVGTVIVSGGARGVDQTAALAGRSRQLQVIEHFADWERFGKRAGMLRNQDIINDADQVTAFWNAKSKGTFDSITKARAAGKPVKIIYPRSDIPGMVYIPEYLDTKQHHWLVDWVDQHGIWMHELKRRVQHYGYRYDYRKKAVDMSMKLPAPPTWMTRLGAKLVSDGFFPDQPDQLIVNEYAPGQGIAAHVDCVPCFSAVIVSISLLSPVWMDFRNRKDGRQISLWLEPRSLVMLTGESRYDWTHSIPARMNDIYHGDTIPRDRRLSITMRKVIINGRG